ncbi:FAD-dependent urate hydroxylase [Quillaja saponaria]|uniref:FAD-dependent urate hydroxylase n=1 Tax=Quillaja saponaria TaxID=32244 RepID=A0AAD7L1B1_QUISA|nr:FAD-dependent urate hydroxylase [Quillaja saponaria]
MEITASEDRDVVIVGGGICGLATALALHRKGIRSLVLERSGDFRIEGAGIGILTNGWRALDQLGVGSKLRQTSIRLHGVRDIWLESGKQRQSPLSRGESRFLKRSDLIKTLADEIPPATIRFGCHIRSVEMDTLTSYPILQLHDGSTLRAKVLIGCDGAHSVVAEFLELKPKKIFATNAVRGFTYCPNGHGYASEFVRMRTRQALLGRIPVNDKLVGWFLVQQAGYPHDTEIAKDPELIRQQTLKRIMGCPAEMIELVKNCDLSSLSLTHLRYRAPWDILQGRFREGTITVAGDAMHVMGPFLGQGGSAGIEDAIVLARCLAPKLKEYDSVVSGKEMMVQKVLAEALDEYLKERRMRLFWLSTQTYLTGSLLDTSSLLAKLIILVLMAVLFRDPTWHTKYDCGNL